MSLFTMKQLLDDAYQNHYAIPAFNFDNFELLVGVFRGAEEAQTPVIIQITEPAIEWLTLKNVVSVVKNEVERCGLPVALHLDHASNFDLIKSCVKAGFTSVMIDYSDKDIKQNMEMTRQVVDFAKKFNVSVESEVGVVSNINETKELSNDFTSFDQAIDFCQYTQIDVLGISIGNTHGMKNRTASLDIERLIRINDKLQKPLALHGSSGVKEDDLVKATKFGVTKVNIETELRVAFKKAIEEIFRDKPNEIKPRNIMAQVRQRISEHVIEHYKLLNSYGKCANFK